MSNTTTNVNKCAQFTKANAQCQRRPGGSTPDGKRWCSQHGANKLGFIPLGLGLPPQAPNGASLFEKLLPPRDCPPEVLQALREATVLAAIPKEFPFFAALIGKAYRKGMPYKEITLRVLNAVVAIPNHAAGLFPAGRSITILSTVNMHNTFCQNDEDLIESVVASICGDTDSFDNLLSGLSAVALPAVQAQASDAAVQVSGVQASDASAGGSSSTALVIEGVTGAQSPKAYMAARLDYAINRLGAMVKNKVSNRLDALQESDKVAGILSFSKTGQTLGGEIVISTDDILRAAGLFNVPSGLPPGTINFSSGLAALMLTADLEMKLTEYKVDSATLLHNVTASKVSVWKILAEQAAQLVQGSQPQGAAATQADINARDNTPEVPLCLNPLCPGTEDPVTFACTKCDFFCRPFAVVAELSDAQLKARSRSALNSMADDNTSLAASRMATSAQEIKAVMDLTSSRAAKLVKIVKTVGVDGLSPDEAAAILGGKGDERIAIGTHHFKQAPGLSTAMIGLCSAYAREKMLYLQYSVKLYDFIIQEQYQKLPLGALLRVGPGVSNDHNVILSSMPTKASQIKCAPVKSAPLFSRYLFNLQAIVCLFNNCTRVNAGFDRVRAYMEDARECNLKFIEFLTVYSMLLDEHAANMQLWLSDPSADRPDPFDMAVCPQALKAWKMYALQGAIRIQEDEAGWFGQATTSSPAPAPASGRPAKKQRKDGDGAGTPKAAKGKQAKSNSPTPSTSRDKTQATPAKAMPPAAWRGDLKAHLKCLRNNGVCVTIKKPDSNMPCDCDAEKYRAFYPNPKMRYCIHSKDEPHFQPGAVPARLLFVPRE